MESVGNWLSFDRFKILILLFQYSLEPGPQVLDADSKPFISGFNFDSFNQEFFQEFWSNSGKDGDQLMDL